MLKKNTLFLNLISALIISTFGETRAENYFVSNFGYDNNNGTTIGTSWKTIAKVNSADLKPGDKISFEAGGIWRETLNILHSGAPGNNIVFTRYGDGKNPLIAGSLKAEDWTTTGTPNVWQTGTSLDNLSEEYYSGRIFFLFDDTTAWGSYQEYNAGFTNLTEEFDYTVIGTTHYVYSTRDPDEAYESVEVTQEDMCISIPDNEPVSYIEFNGIDFKFARLGGFDAGYPAIRGATDLIFRNCRIGYIGFRASGHAYGIAAWHSNFLVENCTFSDCGRRAISINLYLEMPADEQRNLNNITVRDNVFKRGFHTTGLDLSSQQTQRDTMTNVYVYNNLFDDSEHTEIPNDWISNQVFTQAGDSYINNVYIFNNIFIHATGRSILIEDGDSIFIWNNTIMGHNPNIEFNPYANVSLNSPLWVDFRNNILYDDLPNNAIQNHGVLMYYSPSRFLEKDYNLYYSLHPKTDRNFSAHRADNNLNGNVGYWNTNDWNEYLSDNPNFDQNSPNPADPLFINMWNDLSLQKGSPARGAGVRIDMITSDYYGNKMNDPPDLGAIQSNSEITSNSSEEVPSNGIMIIPNPASHSFEIEIPAELSAQIYKVTIYDLQGKLVFKEEGYSGQIANINIPENTLRGIYMVKVCNYTFSFVKKLVIAQE